jgi:hypothetical protein
MFFLFAITTFDIASQPFVPRRPQFPALSTRIPIGHPVALTWPVGGKRYIWKSMGEGGTAAWRRRARARGVNGELGERSWRVRWVKNAWEKEY